MMIDDLHPLTQEVTRLRELVILRDRQRAILEDRIVQMQAAHDVERAAMMSRCEAIAAERDDAVTRLDDVVFGGGL